MIISAFNKFKCFLVKFFCGQIFLWSNFFVVKFFCGQKHTFDTSGAARFDGLNNPLDLLFGAGIADGRNIELSSVNFRFSGASKNRHNYFFSNDPIFSADRAFEQNFVPRRVGFISF